MKRDLKLQWKFSARLQEKPRKATNYMGADATVYESD